MEISLSIANEDQYMQDVAKGFMNELVGQLRKEIIQSVGRDKFQTYYQNLLFQPFMHWIYGKIIDYPLDRFIQMTTICIIDEQQDGNIIIRPSYHFNYPGTKTPMALIWKYLAYGDGNLMGIHQIPTIFNDYNRKINLMWEEYKEEFLEQLYGGGYE